MDIISLKDRIINQLKRHATGVITILAGVLILFLLGNVVWMQDNLHVVSSGFLRAGLWIFLFLIITKFAFPELNIQGTIKNDPIAVAILAGCIALALAVIF